jgi:serine/threonine protein kinase
MEKQEERIQLVNTGGAEETPRLRAEELVDTVIGGQYRLTRLLGSGANGSVYEAYHSFLDRKVALKMLHPDLRWDKEVLLRFSQEARALAKLDHPNLVEVHEFGIDGEGTPYLVMDYDDGISLDKWLKEKGRLLSDDVAQIGIQCADALQHAHERGVFHRDIKPSNIVLHEGTDEWKANIIDFGIVKVQGDPSITQTGSVIGTPAYLSPEALQGHQADARSDMYSLAATLFEALMGCAPYEASSPVELIHKLNNEPLPLMPGDAWPALKDAIQKAMHPNRERRFRSMSEFRQALVDAQSKPAATPLQRWGLSAQRALTGDVNPRVKSRITFYFGLFLLLFMCAGLWMVEVTMLDLGSQFRDQQPTTVQHSNQTWYQLMLDAEKQEALGHKDYAASLYQRALKEADRTEPVHRSDRIEQTKEELSRLGI